MNLNGITLSAKAQVENIKFESDSIIDFDGFSSNGIKRHIDYKVVDSKIAFEGKYTFNILYVDSSDITALEAINGTEITFQSYSTEPTYNTTCSIKPINRVMQSQLVKGYSLVLRIIDKV